MMQDSYLISVVIISNDETRMADNIASVCEAVHGISHEIIVVCQGYKNIPKHFYSNINLKFISFPHNLGISAARNKGILVATGKYISFLDDDVKPDINFFRYAIFFLGNRESLVAVIGKICIENNPNSTLFRKFSVSSKSNLSKYSQWRLSNGVSIIYLNQKKLFDERLGVGTYFGSCEDTDYLIRMAATGLVSYEPSLIVFHPEMSQLALVDDTRVRSYGRGLSGCFMKNISLGGLLFFCASLAKNFLNALLFLRSSGSVAQLKVVLIKLSSCREWVKMQRAERTKL